ncbi:phage tail protein [Pantoea ananatis]|uniref:phage tail protein n=1 Tax=Pantoea ananas TaxID=553 RepID=UPI0039B987C1
MTQNTVLYSLLGVAYGGNGTTTFQLPYAPAARRGWTDAAHAGQQFRLGVGEPAEHASMHQHGVTAASQPDGTKKTASPASGVALSTLNVNTERPFLAVAPNTQFSPTMLMPTGIGQAHENRQPYLAVNFCIALQGNYPVFN